MSNPRENPALLAEDAPTRRDEIDADMAESAGNPAANGRRISDESNVHDAGSDANDTQDGLTEQEEAVRHAAEDIPTGQDPAGKTDSVPVFDRASLPPKI